MQRWEKNSPSSKPGAHRHADRHSEVPTFAPTLYALYLDAEIKKKHTNKMQDFAVRIKPHITWSWVSVKFVNIADNNANKDNIVLELTSSVVTISGSSPSMLV